MPVEAVPSGDPHARPSNWLIRDFVVGERESGDFLAAGDPDAPPPDVERPTVLLMGTTSDDRNDPSNGPCKGAMTSRSSSTASIESASV